MYRNKSTLLLLPLLLVMDVGLTVHAAYAISSPPVPGLYSPATHRQGLAPHVPPSRKKKLGRRRGGREILCPMWRTYVHQASWGAGARSARAPRSAARSAAQYGIAAARSGGAPHRRSPPYAVTARKARRASQVEPVNCLSSNRSSSRASARPAPSPSALLVTDRVSLLLCT